MRLTPPPLLPEKKPSVYSLPTKTEPFVGPSMCLEDDTNKGSVCVRVGEASVCLGLYEGWIYGFTNTLSEKRYKQKVKCGLFSFLGRSVTESSFLLESSVKMNLIAHQTWRLSGFTPVAAPLTSDSVSSTVSIVTDNVPWRIQGHAR